MPTWWKRAKLDLAYHAAFLDALGMDASGKIVLRMAARTATSLARSSGSPTRTMTLPLAVRRRLVIENDDRLFTAQDVLALSRCNRSAHGVRHAASRAEPASPDAPDLVSAVDEAAATWKPGGRRAQKMHYAQQAPGRRPGSHTDTIELCALSRVLPIARRASDRIALSGMPDIMLESEGQEPLRHQMHPCTSEHGR